MRLAAVLLPLAAALPAMADPPHTDDESLHTPSRTVSQMRGACSYTTEMFARRVLDEGEPWTFTGHLTPAPDPLPSHVAAPFTVGPDGDIHVVATEVLDGITEGNRAEHRLALRGKRLNLEGVSYFVLTEVGEGELSR